MGVVTGVMTTLWGMTAASAAGVTGGFPTTPPTWPFVYGTTANEAPITSGVSLQDTVFGTLAGPLAAHTLTVDLSNPNVRLGAVLANNKVYSKDETVSSMAARTGAVAGINGDFFEIGASGRPENLVMVNGQVLQSQLPGGYAVIGATNDGHVTIGPESFHGTVQVTTFVPPGVSTGTSQTVTNATYGVAKQPTYSIVAVNRPGLEKGGNLSIYTPAMGSQVYVPDDTVAYLTAVNASNSYQVTSIKSGVKTLPALSNGIALAAGQGAAATWLSNNLSPGDIVRVTEQLSPDANIVNAVGSGYQLLRNGNWYKDPHALGIANVYTHNPLTAIGVSKDGTKTFLVVFDGRNSNLSLGLTYPQMAMYLKQLGAWNAAMLDGGGSSDMVARLSGQQHVSVVNHPSDGVERQVADGWFVYSTETALSPTDSISLNNGQELSMMQGASTTVAVYGVDAAGNPTNDNLTLSVNPSSLAQVKGNQLSAVQTGTGSLIATAPNGVQATVPLTVAATPSQLTVSPTGWTLSPGQSASFSAEAFDARGQTMVLPRRAIQWSITPNTHADVDSSGKVTTVPQIPTDPSYPGASNATVIASVGGITASGFVQVGYSTHLLDRMGDVRNWMVSKQTFGQLKFTSSVAVHGQQGSMEIAYDYPKSPGVEQVVFWPKRTMTFTSNAAGDHPVGLGLWVKGDNSQLSFAVSVTGQDGQRDVLYPTTINFTGWRFVTIPFPSSLGSKVTVNFLDFLTKGTDREQKGALYCSNLQALYPPDATPPVSVQPNALAPWFSHAVTPAQFSLGDPTLVFSNGTLRWTNDPIETVDMASLKATDITTVQQPQSLQKGKVDILILNTASGSISAGDPYQTSPHAQFPWLIQQLKQTTAKVILVVATQGPYSSVPGDSTPILNATDATALETFLSTFQSTHPGQHVFGLFGGYANGQVNLRWLNAEGQDAPQGVLNVTTPLLGKAKLSSELLIHVSHSGNVEWIAMPVSSMGSASLGGSPPLER